VRIGGGHFAGSGSALLNFADLFKNIISEFQKAGVFFGKDQSLFAYLNIRHPYLFDPIVPENCPRNYDIWFCIQFYWSSSARSIDHFAFSSMQVNRFTMPTLTDKCSAQFLIPSTSSSSSAQYRSAIRYGWISKLALLRPLLKFQYNFILGRNLNLEIKHGTNATALFLKKEIELYRDIVIFPFFDSPRNLTVKVALMLKWATQKYPSCPFVFKVDETVYIRPESLSLFLHAPLGTQLIYGGHFNEEKSKGRILSKSYPYIFSSTAVSSCYFLSASLIISLPYKVYSYSSELGQNILQEYVPDFYVRNSRVSDEHVLFESLHLSKNIVFLHVSELFPWNYKFSSSSRFLAVGEIRSPDFFRTLSSEHFVRKHEGIFI
jgi:hypothetical protein